MSAYVWDWPHQMHPSRSDHTMALGNRLDALDDEQRRLLLHFLAGYKPAAVELAIGRLETPCNP
jgi:hypothetical protein